MSSLLEGYYGPTLHCRHFRNGTLLARESLLMGDASGNGVTSV
jgi:hypothetical protein